MTPPQTRFDVRVPLGALFTLLGAVLLAYGIATRDDAVLYVPAGALNVNRDWGLVMVATGLLFLAVAWWRRRPPPP